MVALSTMSASLGDFWRGVAVGWLWRVVACAALSPPVLPAVASGDFYAGGHVKGQYVQVSYPDDSIYRESIGRRSQDYFSELRATSRAAQDAWDVAADYQLLARYGDSVTVQGGAGGSAQIGGELLNDDLRWFNLTSTLSDGDDYLVVHRLDRLSLGYTGEQWVVRFGRQVLSWGNGMVYTPMDFLNPFDPAAVDTEHKTGDDMLYGQYLRASGDDIQFAAVLRRSPDSGDVEASHSTAALKYHGFAAGLEYDALLARHYSDVIAGIGGNHALGGAIWRGDLTLTRREQRLVPQFVTSLSTSWTLWQRNVSGHVEYYYNGFGIRDGDYSAESLLSQQDLLERLARGELYTLARSYGVGSMLVEVNPLLVLTGNLFVNLNDGSALLQWVAQYDLAQDLLLLAALGVPVGENGTEFGGIESPAENLYLSQSWNFFLQLAWYF